MLSLFQDYFKFTTTLNDFLDYDFFFWLSFQET